MRTLFKYLADVATGMTLVAIAACTTTGSEPPQGAILGAAGCETSGGDLCPKLSGNTINSWGPRRYDYLAPNGDLIHWQGNSLSKGKWYMQGSAICLSVPELGTPRCGMRSQIVADVDSVLIGDAFGLSTRTSAPAQIAYGRGDTDENYLRQAGVDPQTVTIIKGLPK